MLHEALPNNQTEFKSLCYRADEGSTELYAFCPLSSLSHRMTSWILHESKLKHKTHEKPIHSGAEK